MSGTVRMLDGAEADRARHVYGEVFPQIPILGGATGGLAQALLRIRWYELEVEHLRFIDNAVGFGHRREWSRAEFLLSGVGRC